MNYQNYEERWSTRGKFLWGTQRGLAKEKVFELSLMRRAKETKNQ